ncbi:hypothetical protein CFP56_013872 [Quercus suber]|uniref:Uncharacterized protein n=1 Tax=Quercus suber TaxID=58331 RepID=A0AAW0M2K8_QUESU
MTIPTKVIPNSCIGLVGTTLADLICCILDATWAVCSSHIPSTLSQAKTRYWLLPYEVAIKPLEGVFETISAIRLLLKPVPYTAQHSKLMKKKRSVTASLTTVFYLKAKTVSFNLNKTVTASFWLWSSSTLRLFSSAMLCFMPSCDMT